jgi:hypothetical protein
MEYQDYLQDAIDLVDAWEIPEEDFPQAVNDQARLMCGLAQKSPSLPADLNFRIPSSLTLVFSRDCSARYPFTPHLK